LEDINKLGRHRRFHGLYQNAGKEYQASRKFLSLVSNHIDRHQQAEECSEGLMALTRTLERDIKPEEGFLISELQLVVIEIQIISTLVGEM